MPGTRLTAKARDDGDRLRAQGAYRTRMATVAVTDL
jgi:hypothetical protein